MARTRLIKPGFFANDDLAELDPICRLLFIGLWIIADKEGRLKDSPRRIHALCLPYDQINVDSCLNQLQSNGFLLRYLIKNQSIIQILNWRKHQRPHHKEVPSELPERPKNYVKIQHDNDGQANLNVNTDQEQSNVSGSCHPLTLNPSPLTLNPSLRSSDKKNYDENDFLAGQKMFELIQNLNPGQKTPNFESWANSIRKIRERDKRTLSEIQELFRWANNDEFWFKNILSPEKLRSKWDQLTIAKNNSPKPAGENQYDATDTHQTTTQHSATRAGVHNQKLSDIAKRDIEENGISETLGSSDI